MFDEFDFRGAQERRKDLLKQAAIARQILRTGPSPGYAKQLGTEAWAILQHGARFCGVLTRAIGSLIIPTHHIAQSK